MDFGERFDLPYPQFVFLDAQVVSFMTESDNRLYQAMYVDCLALLHDLLITMCTVPEASMFDPREINEDLETSMLKLQEPDVTDEQQLSLVESLLDNLHKNRISAFTLFQQSTGFEFGVVSYRVRFSIDSYLDDLLKQYRIIRYPYAFAAQTSRG
jgi:hypothetical protein